MSQLADRSTSSEPFEAEARVSLFGFDPTSAVVRLRPRSRAWRLSGTIRILAITAVLAPSVVVVPPHVPWVLGVLATGIVLARRRWTHRFTLEGLTATCPRCGAELAVVPGRLRIPQPVTCPSCRHDESLEVDVHALEPGGSPGGS